MAKPTMLWVPKWTNPTYQLYNKRWRCATFCLLRSDCLLFLSHKSLSRQYPIANTQLPIAALTPPPYTNRAYPPRDRIGYLAAHGKDELAQDQALRNDR